MFGVGDYREVRRLDKVGYCVFIRFFVVKVSYWVKVFVLTEGSVVEVGF